MTFRPLKGVGGLRAVRRLLKTALRYGLRCMRIHPEDE
jgi:hypothetical protein